MLKSTPEWNEIERKHAIAQTKTLRDEFAMAALPIVLERFLRLGIQKGAKKSDLATEVYKIADALMEARK